MGAIERVRAVRRGETNVGGAERLVRGTVGPVLIAVGIATLAGVVVLARGTPGVALAVVVALAGARMTQTAITRRCYVNAILGRDSCTAAGSRSDPPARNTS